MRTKAIRIPAALAAALSLAAGCSDGGGSGDGDGDADAAPDGRQGSCASGEIEVQGDWIDWDSSDQSFMGIFDAQITAVADPANSVTTAPNGRAIICLAAGTDHRLAFNHADYLPMSFDLAAENLEAVYSARALTETRAEELFSLEFGLTFDPDAAHVVLEIPAAADASIDAASAGEFRTLEDRYLFFANAPVSGPSNAALSVTPPPGQSCSFAEQLGLESGTITFSNVVCR